MLHLAALMYKSTATKTPTRIQMYKSNRNTDHKIQTRII